MKKNSFLKRNFKISLSQKIMIVLVGTMIIIYSVFIYINFAMSSIILEYAKQHTYKFTTLVINKSISTQIKEKFSVDDIIKVEKDNQNLISSIDFDTMIINSITQELTAEIQSNLLAVEYGKVEEISNLDIERFISRDDLSKGVISKVPLGIVFNLPLLANMGPYIPIKYQIVGSVNSGVKTVVSEYGINNAMIEVYIDIEIRMRTLLPVSSGEHTVTTTIPLVMKLVNGKVPQAYLGTRWLNDQ